jgi:hypothetical protein
MAWLWRRTRTTANCSMQNRYNCPYTFRPGAYSVDSAALSSWTTATDATSRTNYKPCLRFCRLITNHPKHKT